MITILSSLAQEESRNISENVTWAYRKQFQEGKVVVNSKRFLGFDKDENGKLIINEEQARLVRRIYTLYEDGFTETMIAHRLNADQIPGIYGKPSWDHGVIGQLLTNEKYKGDLLLQKTYTPDFLKKRSVKNNGERDQYYIENDHEAIIPPDEWEAVQLERERRQAFKLRYNVPYIRNGIDPIHPFAGKIICGQCNDVYKAYEGDRFKCRRRIKTGARECTAQNIYVKDVEIAFIRAWRELLSDTAARVKWEEKIKSGNPLERLRGKQFIALAGSADEEYSPELVMKVLEKVQITCAGEMIFNFLDGTEVRTGL